MLGRDFGWLWGAFAVSTAGTWLAFDAFPLIAVLVLGAGPAEVAVLAAAGLAVGALLAVPLGPWVEFRRKKPVMVGADLVRCAVVLSIPVAFALGVLTFPHLLVVSVVVAAADIAFRAASGAYLRDLLPREHLLVANGRFESTSWTATALGPPLGGALIGVFGPVVTLVVDAVSYLLSALGLGAVRHRETAPERPGRRMGRAELLDGWRHVLSAPDLRALFVNTTLFNGLLLATTPLIAVLMLRDLGFAPWQYGLAFGAPCVGGLLGARLAPRLVRRFGEQRVLLASGVARTVWPLGLALVRPGTAGLVLVIAVQFGLVACCGVFNPVLATYRLTRSPPGVVARVLAAWSVTSKAAVAGLTALWGLLGGLLGPRTAIAAAGLLILATPVPLWRARAGAAPARPAEPAPR
ncbi:MFS transporter [Actinokineospora bangkokensis]|uniref:MFS transporter n=1 Tax=Actinokineospora bangkokensis TaxID=1193682 RepID=A0A1Q9LJY1_9PSEU|nr:MFS transporter [Actinokineospora bangkokensis]OLR92338.1 MFS transporter [Actinokineospora bangkokensis]